MKHLVSKLWVLTLGAAALTGCGVPGIPKPPSLDLPQPVGDLRAIRKGDKVYLAWTVPSETTDHQKVRQPGLTRICRTTDSTMNQCGTPVMETLPLQMASTSGRKEKEKIPLPAKITAQYVDTLPFQVASLTGEITYAVEVLNAQSRDAGLSNKVQVSAAPTLPPPDNFKAEIAAEGVVLSWAAIPRESENLSLRHVYRVYRRERGANADTVVGESPLEAVPELVDHSFEWEKTYDYRATVVTLVPVEGKPDIPVEGDDTPSVEVFAHDVFPPAVPSGLQAVYSGVGQQPFIDLIWAPDTDADLAGYNVYRREEGFEAARINTELVKTPVFRDRNLVAGHTYSYSVSAVDVRGNESARSEKTNESVP
jgi:hypothetical protein